MKHAKLTIFLVVFIDLVGFGVVIPMLPFYAKFFGANALKVGWLMFVYSFLQMLCAPIWGQMSDRFGRRPILLLTIFGQAIAFLWGGFAASYLVLLLTRVFAGFFSANISTASAYIADITSPEERAKGMGLIGAAFGLGFIFGPAIGGILHSHFGPQYPMIFAACLSFLNITWAYFVLKEPPGTSAERSQHRRRFDLRQLKEILGNSKLLFPIIIFFLLTFAFVQLEITFGFFMMKRFEFTEEQVGLALAGMGFIMAMIQGGAIGRLVKRFGELKLISAGIPIIVLGLVGLILSPTLWLIFASLCVMAIGYGITNPCLSAVTSKSAPAGEQGSVLGVYQSASSAARVLAPPVAGSLYDMNIIGAFIGGAICAFLAKLTFGLYSRRTVRSS